MDNRKTYRGAKRTPEELEIIRRNVERYRKAVEAAGQIGRKFRPRPDDKDEPE